MTDVESDAPHLPSASDPRPAGPGPGIASDATPAVLADLIAAGLVSHEMIGDPERLGGETAALRALCAVVAGPVWRIDAYHYAFRATSEDLDGALAALVPGAWTGALAAALTEVLGPEAVWLNPTDLLPEAGRALAQPLLLLRAHDAAVRAGLEAAGPGLQAVVNARYAADVARLTAGATERSVSERFAPERFAPERLAAERFAAEQLAGGGALATRLAALETRQAEILAALGQVAGRLEAAFVASHAAADAASRDVAAASGAVAARLDAQTAALTVALDRQDARLGAMAGQVADLAASLAADRLNRPGSFPETFPEAFRETFQGTVGVTVAELLARVERQAEEGRAARVPQFS